MRPWKRWTLIGLGAFFAAATVFIVPTVWFKPYSVNHFYGRVFLRFALQSPMLLSQLGFLPPALDFHSDELDDVSPEAEDRAFRFVQRELGVLRSFDRGAMRFLGEVLDRPANKRAVMLIVTGYPAPEARVPRLVRKSLSEIATFR